MLRRIKRIWKNGNIWVLKNKTVTFGRFSFWWVKITSRSTCFWAQGCGRRERADSPSVVRSAHVLPWGCWPAPPGFLGSLCPSALSRPATVHSFPGSEWDWTSSGSQSELHLFGPCGHSGRVKQLYAVHKQLIQDGIQIALLHCFIKQNVYFIIAAIQNLCLRSSQCNVESQLGSIQGIPF